MLDIKFIRENAKQVKKAAKDKQVDVDIDELLKLDKQRREVQTKVDNLRKKRNQLAKAGKSGKPSAKQKAEGKKIKGEITKLEKESREVEEKYNELMYLVPNIPSADTPVGEGDDDNKELKKWGKIPKFDFEIKDHIQLGKELDIIDFDRGVKVHGFRGYFLKNEGALLQMALMLHAFGRMVEKGFVPMLNPVLLKEFALYGSGHFPFGREEVFQVANPGKLESGKDIKDPMFLGGTAEPSLLAYYAKEKLSKDELPVKLCGFSSCFRSEVGSYGKDTKGLYRIHEFMKVEQVVLCENDYKISMKYFEEMREIAEEIMQELKLPYRVVQTCTAEMGAGKYRMDDIETWMPSRNSYSETHSCSNLGDWQSRRLNIKYEDGKEKKFVHALNNTVIASPRILIALLECNQQRDGSVLIPEVLRKYISGEKYIITKVVSNKL